MLYKYYSGNNYSIESLTNQEFWFSKPTEFNDPFDCNMQVLDEFLEFKDKMAKRNPDLVMGFQESAKNFGICCFSEEADNMHLWALYANSFKGFVLCFEKDGVDDYFTDLFKAKCTLESAIYQEKPLNLDNGSIEEIQFNVDGSQNGVISKPVNSYLYDNRSFDILLEYLIKQKREEIWTIEKEKRLIIGGLARMNGAKRFEYKLGYSVPWKPNSLKKIILGHRMTQESKIIIRDIKNKIDPEIEILQTSLDFTNWTIKLKPLCITF